MSEKFITARMDELLKPLGFSRHKGIWNRRTGSFVDVVDVQVSKANDAMTINAGVLHPEVHRKCWAAEAPPVIEEPLCTVRARIGQLVEDKDLWWQLHDGGAGNDVVEKLNRYVLPFLERMHSIDAMEKFLSESEVTKQKYPLPVLCLAILKNERGDKTGACSLLAEFGKKTVGAWRTRINEVAQRLQCS